MPALSGPESERSSSVSASVDPWVLAEAKGNMGVEGGYIGDSGTFARSGSTKAFHGPWKGFPSTYKVCKAGRRHSQLGRACNLFLRTLTVWSLSRSTRVSGSVLIPVESAMMTRRFVRSARKTGRTRNGFEAMFSSSRCSQTASTGGSAPKKLADISRASSV